MAGLEKMKVEADDKNLKICKVKLSHTSLLVRPLFLSIDGTFKPLYTAPDPITGSL